MKLSTLTAPDLEIIKNSLITMGFQEEELNEYPSSELAQFIVEEFRDNNLFTNLFDYNADELSTILQSLNIDDIFNSVKNKVTEKLDDIGQGAEYQTLQSSMNSQQFIDDAIQQEKSEGKFVEKVETDNAAARRMNITVTQLLTLRSLKEKDRLSLTKEMNTKDKAGKNAKTKVVKFVTFNEKFDKGFVSLEYPKLKGWLPMSMTASEFFRKTNTKIKVITKVEADKIEADSKQQEELDAIDNVDFSNESNNIDYDGIGNFPVDLIETPQQQAVVAETPAQQQIANQEFIEQAIEEAEANGELIEPKQQKTETDAAKARRLNITIPQLETLRQLKEKQLIPLKTPMSTKDRAGKNAKAKNIKFVSFNDKFQKGIVFLEYPHLKGWLTFSMGVSEFFRKTNLRLKK